VQLQAQNEYSAGNNSESVASDATYQEEFSWSSVILPYVSHTFLLSKALNKIVM
ncbi:sugar transporter, partial [Trifolium medium]|nr:sugar transporter [Trifolium medium]